MCRGVTTPPPTHREIRVIPIPRPGYPIRVPNLATNPGPSKSSGPIFRNPTSSLEPRVEGSEGVTQGSHPPSRKGVVGETGYG